MSEKQMWAFPSHIHGALWTSHRWHPVTFLCHTFNSRSFAWHSLLLHLEGPVWPSKALCFGVSILKMVILRPGEIQGFAWSLHPDRTQTRSVNFWLCFQAFSVIRSIDILNYLFMGRSLSYPGASNHSSTSFLFFFFPRPFLKAY